MCNADIVFFDEKYMYAFVYYVLESINSFIIPHVRIVSHDWLTEVHHSILLRS